MAYTHPTVAPALLKLSFINIYLVTPATELVLPLLIPGEGSLQPRSRGWPTFGPRVTCIPGLLKPCDLSKSFLPAWVCGGKGPGLVSSTRTLVLGVWEELCLHPCSHRLLSGWKAPQGHPRVQENTSPWKMMKESSRVWYLQAHDD